MLVTDLVNVRYLSGFTGSNGALLVFADDRDPVLATDGRYRTQAAEQAPGLEIAIERNGLTVIGESGVIYNLFADRFQLSTDMDANYMVVAEKAA